MSTNDTPTSTILIASVLRTVGVPPVQVLGESSSPRTSISLPRRTIAPTESPSTLTSRTFLGAAA